MGGNEQQVANDCSLPRSQQTRNLLLFAACTGLIYLAAPVGYVGVTQASLCKKLEASAAVANLPATVYLSLTPTPVLLAWLVPSVALLKRNLAICFGANAMVMAVVTLTLLSPVTSSAKIAVVIAQGAVSGMTMPAAIAFLWEALGRGVTESRRGLALSLAFGAGPILAVIGSLGSDVLLSGQMGDWKLTGLEFPLNFALLFGLAAPIMVVAAIFASCLVVPLPSTEAVREPFGNAVFGGLRRFLGDPVLRIATIVTILVYTGNTAASNLNLYTEEVLGLSPEHYAGKQNALRFGFKVAAGFLFGWLLTKSHPKAGLLTTASVYVASLGFAMVAAGDWYLLTLGIYGAGELFGVYAPNYILSASRQPDIRRNMAFVTMMMAPAAPTGYLLGVIADHYGQLYGKATGFRISFAVCAAIMMIGIVLAVFRLPARPRCEDEVRSSHPPP